MRICLLDPGLKGLTGHHFDLDLRLVRAFARRGHDVHVHGYRQPDPALVERAKAAGIELHHTFRVPTYAPLPEQVPASDAYRQMAQATAKDLADVEPTDLWLWPTLSPYQFAAAAAQRTAVRQLGGVWATPRFPQPAGASFWARTAQRVVQDRVPMVVGAFDEAIRAVYHGFSPGLDMPLLPAPHDGAPRRRHSPAPRRVGFFGHQRPARGLDILPELVRGLLLRGYEVVMQDSGGRMADVGADPNLNVLSFVEDFAAEIAQCDLVIWPSRWESYQQQCSGVVSEAVASGVPVILPSGSLPAQTAGRLHAGIPFHEFRAAAILAAVDETARNYAAESSRSQAAALAWQATNGTDRLVASIESMSSAWAAL